MKKHKIGLVLGGGGAKGAYQAGALKAMKEANLIKNITYVSANSIGTINDLMFMSDKIDESYDIWLKINKKQALSLRKKTEKNPGDKFGLFSRQGIVELLKNNVDFDKVSNSKRHLYITAYNKDLEKLEYFCCDKKNQNEIISYALASSAIPYIYAPVKIDKYFYHDGYKDNVPIEILKKQGCDIIIVMGLNPNYLPSEEILKDIKVIDFTPPFLLGTSKFSSLDFKASNINFRIKNGYEVAKKIIAENFSNPNSPFYHKKGVLARFKRFIFRNQYNVKGKNDFYYRLKEFQQIGKLNEKEVNKQL